METNVHLVRFDGWGGPEPLQAGVRTVEPAAFTEVSALGVEEQRVNVIGGFAQSPPQLGDGYRVTVRIVVVENGQPDEAVVPPRPLAARVPPSPRWRPSRHWSLPPMALWESHVAPSF